MRRALLVMTLFLGLGIWDVSAQHEVRGIVINLVTYEGESYNYRDETGHWIKKTTWFGWELCNRNSIPVSVDIEVWVEGWVEGKDREFLYSTESIFLESGEKYILKPQPLRARMYYFDTYYSYIRDANDVNRWIKVKYKAYKLE